VTGALVSNAGTWMQRVAQDWLVLTVLTDDSGLAVGITTAFQFGPMVLLAPFAGVLADRVDRRKMLLATQAVSGLLALALGVLVLTGAVQLWHVYLLAGLLGVASAVDAPPRQAFVSQLVPEADLANAVGLNSASFHAGRLIGPGLAGWLIHWFGTGPVFLINAVSFGAVLMSLTRMRREELIESPRAGGGRTGLRAGLGYVRRRPDLILIMGLIGIVGTFGLNFQLTTALMARLVFDKGAGEYGMLGSVMAVGSLAGALFGARRTSAGPRLVVVATLVFSVFAIAASLMPTYVTFALALIPVGLAALTLMTAANTSVQLATEPAMRGRVMALYMAVFLGGTPLGAPLIGWVGERFGARWTISGGAAVCLVAALGALAWLRAVPASGRSPGRSAAEQGVDLVRVGDRRDGAAPRRGQCPGGGGPAQRGLDVGPGGQRGREAAAERVAGGRGVDRGDRVGGQGQLGAGGVDGHGAPGPEGDDDPARPEQSHPVSHGECARGVVRGNRLAEQQ
jgi:MFS family permease